MANISWLEPYSLFQRKQNLSNCIQLGVEESAGIIRFVVTYLNSMHPLWEFRPVYSSLQALARQSSLDVCTVRFYVHQRSCTYLDILTISKTDVPANSALRNVCTFILVIKSGALYLSIPQHKWAPGVYYYFCCYLYQSLRNTRYNQAALTLDLIFYSTLRLLRVCKLILKKIHQDCATYDFSFLR